MFLFCFWRLLVFVKLFSVFGNLTFYHINEPLCRVVQRWGFVADSFLQGKDSTTKPHPWTILYPYDNWSAKWFSMKMMHQPKIKSCYQPMLHASSGHPMPDSKSEPSSTEDIRSFIHSWQNTSSLSSECMIDSAIHRFVAGRFNLKFNVRFCIGFQIQVPACGAKFPWQKILHTGILF